MNELAVTQSSQTTPLQMLESAVARGADIEIVERLMALYERWALSQSRKAFDNAIAEAKAEMKPVARNKTGHNSKRYADMSAIALAVDPVISKFGLSYRWRTEQGDKINVTCILSHRDGHFEQTTLSAPADSSGNKNVVQSIGSTLTYLQRYSLVQMLGIAVADDDDGAAAGRADTIGSDQINELEKLITEIGGDKAAALKKGFLKKFNIEAVWDLPASEMRNAVDALNAKRTA